MPSVSLKPPRGPVAWKLVPEGASPTREHVDAATLLWGRANRLRNRLQVATSKSERMHAALDYLKALRDLAADVPISSATGTVAVDWLRHCSDPAFALEAMRHATVLYGTREDDGDVLD